MTFPPQTNTGRAIYAITLVSSPGYAKYPILVYPKAIALGLNFYSDNRCTYFDARNYV